MNKIIRSLCVMLFTMMFFSTIAIAGVSSADLSITKTDGVVSATPGGTVTYTIVASNNGPDDVTGATVVDTFPVEFSSCSTTCVAGGGSVCTAGPVVGNLNDTADILNGSSVTYTSVCDILSSATGTLSNTASISSATADPTPGNNSATDGDTVLVPSADLSITKTDGVTSATPGGTLTYTIVATNNGLSDVTGITVVDNFPAELANCSTTCAASAGSSCAAGPTVGNLNDASVNLLNGGSATYTSVCDILSSATGTLSNTASLSSAATDPTPGNDSATDGDTVLVPSGDLSITKTDGVTSATPGGTLTYTIVATNIGLSDVTGITVVDNFPAELANCSTTCVASAGSSCAAGPTLGNLSDASVNLLNSGSVTYTSACDILSSATGTLSNTANISSATSGNDSGTDNDTVLVPTADLSISKSDDADPVSPGATITYTIQVNNSGSSDATNVVVTETLPAGVTLVSTTGCAEDPNGVPTCTLGTIVSGGSASYTVAVTVDSGTIGTISNNVSVTSDVADSNSANDNSSEDTTVSQGAVTLTIDSANPVVPTLGLPANILFTLTVNPPASGTPTGTVTITDGIDGCVATLPATSCQIIFSSIGDKDLTATYSGDTNFNGITSVIFMLGVDPVPIIPTLNEWTLILLILSILMATFFWLPNQRARAL